MAFSININKVAEEEAWVEYEYEDAGRRGRLRLDKASGEVTYLLSATPAIDQRAYWKLLKHRRDGAYPERTQWAS